MKIYICSVVLIVLYCLQDVHGLTWPCESDVDCNFAEGAKCLLTSKQCYCPAGYVFSLNATKCIKPVLHGEKCDESVQCSHMLSGARCKNGVCDCDDGFTYIRGRCRILNDLYGQCNEDVDCFFGYDRESVVCEQHKCKCAKGYYFRFDNICRRKSQEIGDPCVVDQDCVDENRICEKSICVEGKRRSSREIGVQTTIETSFNEDEPKRNNKKFSLGSIKEIQSKHDDSFDSIKETPETRETYSSSNTSSRHLTFGSPCEPLGRPCDNFAHSICLENQCNCKPGYYEKNGICKAELGERAETEENCDFRYRDKKCLCNHNYFYENNLRACIKPVREFGQGCTRQSQCSPFGAAHCGNEGPKICICHKYALFNNSTQLCELKKGLGSKCTTDTECSDKIPNAKCSKDNLCVCKENHFSPDSEKCIAGINAECENDEDCLVENSQCKKTDTTETITESHQSGENESESCDSKGKCAKTCKCQKGFVSFDNTCIKEANEIGEECIEDEQCKPLLGNLGKCIEHKCGCQPNHQLNYGKCNEKKALGDTCSKASECFVEEDPKSVECRNAVCQCQFSYSRDVEKQICVKPKKNSSGRPSPLKVITVSLFTAAFLITSAAIKQAYY